MICDVFFPKLSLIIPEASAKPVPSSQAELLLPPLSQSNSESPTSVNDSQPEVKKQVIDAIILEAITNTAERYPWLTNTSDKLIISPSQYNPQQAVRFVESEFNLNSTVELEDGESKAKNPLLNFFQTSHYPKQKQFYWVLDGNRIVIETQGNHTDLRPQGQLTETNQIEQAVASRTLFGVQAVWGLPSFVPELTGEKEESPSVTTVAAEVVNPAGRPLGGIAINTGVDLSDPNVFLLEESKKGDTFAEVGGGALFENLDADNAPIFLQGFPTVNLQPLFAGDAELELGSTIPEENLANTGIIFGDVLTREGSESQLEFSSLPGIKVLRPNQGSNEDLVRVLSNPFLSREERDFHYLNSLMWFDLGQRSPEFTTLSESQETDSWYRFTNSFSKNRTLLQYDPEEAKADYVNVFSNPGVSISFVPIGETVDLEQSGNASLGMAMGLLFYGLEVDPLSESLREAKQKYETRQSFGRLEAESTPQERRRINQRLNQTVSYSNRSSGLAQVSGSWTFEGHGTPEKAQLFQVRTGLYERRVRFLEETITPEVESPVFVSRLRLANEEFGPIGFRGEQFPVDSTAIDESRTAAAQTIVRSPNGETFVINAIDRDQNTMTTVPFIDRRPFDLTFDLLELSKLETFSIESLDYFGLLYLPAVELLMGGSNGNFKYGFAVGGWFNLAPNSAPGLTEDENITNNDFLTEESALGAFAKLNLSWEFQDFKLNENKEVVKFTEHNPFFIVDWNSQTNYLNEINVLLGYRLQQTTSNLRFNLIPSLSYIPNSTEFEESLNIASSDTSFNVFGNLSTKSGLSGQIDLSLTNEFFWEVEVTQNAIKSPDFGRLSLGAYYSNFTRWNRGIVSRIPNERGGGIIKYVHPNNRFSLEGTLGVVNDKLEGSIATELKLKF